MTPNSMQLDDGARVGVIGGGPAGSFFSIFVLDMAHRMGIDIQVDIYEPRDYTKPGPIGCNMCGGIISESLVQNLAAEGINLPTSIVQRGIDSYMLHMDVGDVQIDTPLLEKRIGAVYRGPGPRDIKEIKWGSFDGYLLDLAIQRGANVIHQRVDEILWTNNRPEIKVRKGDPVAYDLATVAIGVNAAARKLFNNLEIEYEIPKTTKTFIQEYYLGEEKIAEILGSSMHVFLLDIPRLEFAAIIPKGDYVSLCLLGEDIDKELVTNFLETPQVKSCFPMDWDFECKSCNCSPRINVAGSKRPFGDRIVFIGDSGVTRLYKDGIGAAYRTAKSAATTSVLHGVSAEDFEKRYYPTCRKIETDNSIGKLMFIVTRQIQKRRFARRGVLKMTADEQAHKESIPRMSMVLWDMFTGSAPYQEIFVRTLSPLFLSRLLLDIGVTTISRNSRNGSNPTTT